MLASVEEGGGSRRAVLEMRVPPLGREVEEEAEAEALVDTALWTAATVVVSEERESQRLAIV